MALCCIPLVLVAIAGALRFEAKQPARHPDGVAVFWPAAGIASGIMIALGRVGRLPVAVGVMVATVTANLLGDRKN